jgi:4-hydroxy-3-polyprenylbenzoate decarboxylase
MEPDVPTTAATARTNRPDTPWRDAREWIARAEAIGELRVVRGASWQSDIGAIAELLDHTEGSPCVLFDDIPDYPTGRRVIVNCNGTRARQAVTLGLPPERADHAGLLDFWRAVLADPAAIEPVEVATGPVLEHVIQGDAIDLEAFPVPIWHPLDGGRFIGTASMNILRDPQSGWVNVGTYRNQVFGRASLGVYMSPGKHGKLIRETYFARGERCPIVIVVGADTTRHTGLPFPAAAEIVIEGWMEPGDRHPEGPYGEFHGYYGWGEFSAPVVHVEAIYHRTDPILLGCPQGKPPHEDNRALAYLRAVQVEQQLKAAGVPGITGVWCPPEAAERFLTVIAVEQAYPGHATQALTVAGQTGAAAYIARLAVVVDPDIDITNMDDVLWATMTRCDPARDVTIINRAWSGPLDPAIHPDERGFNSRMLIDATKPWEWRDRFAEPVVTADMTRAAREKWGWILAKDG